ncbi:MAG: DUF5698 domain-containing protein [Pseudomonadota bacterium]
MLEFGSFGPLAATAFIFVARILDVSIGTIRIIYVTKGKRYQATILGFFEVLIWIIAINQVMNHTNSWVDFVAYAGGFAIGNFVGITIEDKLAFGKLAIQLITQNETTLLMSKLKEAGFGVTQIEGMGVKTKVIILVVMLNRKRLPEIVKIIDEYAPNTFYAISDVQNTKSGVFPVAHSRKTTAPFDFLRMFRLAK